MTILNRRWHIHIYRHLRDFFPQSRLVKEKHNVKKFRLSIHLLTQGGDIYAAIYLTIREKKIKEIESTTFILIHITKTFQILLLFLKTIPELPFNYVHTHLTISSKYSDTLNPIVSNSNSRNKGMHYKRAGFCYRRPIALSENCHKRRWASNIVDAPV